MEERRARTRFTVRCPVTVITSDGTIQGETKDLSGDGAFIRCQKPPTPKEILPLIIELPDGFPLDVSAEVVWSNASGPDDEKAPRGMGVRFLW
ncbi:MAG: PilZ domain-containing protein [Deltaproteobacteria bacterium]|nr:MAG: PilZ domain-containing protein [Deltaproteobacteria bacterium]